MASIAFGLGMSRANRVAGGWRPSRNTFFTLKRPYARCSIRAQSSVKEELRRLEDERVNMRAEAEAPFRTLRLVIYGFSIASASVATLISLPQLAGALGGARGALVLDDVLQNLAINIGAVTIFGFLFAQDWKAREKQLVRLGRESALAAQRVRLANGKRITLRDLQGSSRCVLLAGTPSQVAASLEAAEQYKEALQQRGVFIIPLTIFDEAASTSSTDGSNGEGSGAVQQPALPPLTKEDLRWRGEPEGLQGYKQWFADQLSLTSSKVNSATGLYVGLRLDGRVRASGMGGAPWPRMVAELAPLEGDKKWSGMLDGFDGDSAPR